LIQMKLDNMTHVQQFESMDELVSALLPAFKADKELHIGLSGGNSPVALYKAIAQFQTSHQSQFFYQVDERYVPAESDESNQRMIRETLIDPIRHNLGGFFSIDTSLPINEAVYKYSQAIETIPNQSFDIIVLGLGTDGHTASLFRGDTTLGDSNALVRHTINPTAPNPPVKDRITLSLHTIMRAKKIVLLVTSAAKWQLVESMLNDQPNTTTLPIHALLPHPNLEIMYAKTV